MVECGHVEGGTWGSSLYARFQVDWFIKGTLHEHSYINMIIFWRISFLAIVCMFTFGMNMYCWISKGPGLFLELTVKLCNMRRRALVTKETKTPVVTVSPVAELQRLCVEREETSRRTIITEALFLIGNSPSDWQWPYKQPRWYKSGLGKTLWMYFHGPATAPTWTKLNISGETWKQLPTNSPLHTWQIWAWEENGRNP